MQELSFKSKPNVWAYFSVKVTLVVKFCVKLILKFLNLTAFYIIICSLEEAFMNFRILNLVSFRW